MEVRRLEMESVEKNWRKDSRSKTEHLQTTWETDLDKRKKYGKRETVNNAVLQILRINNIQKRRSKQIRGERSGKGMVRVERSDWSDF